MPEINYKELEAHIKEVKNDKIPQVYLIYGEEYLYRNVFEELLNVILPGSKKKFNYEPIDSEDGNIFDAVESLNTFSFLSGLKVVSLCDTKLFYSKLDDIKILGKAKEASEKNDLKKASQQLARLLSILDLSFDDIEKEKRKKTLKIDTAVIGDGKWLDKLIEYCKTSDIKIPIQQSSSAVLEKAIEKGFPKGNHLIITTDLIDKRRSLFKIIKKNGMTVDCVVPKGNRWADKKSQDAVLKDSMKRILKNRGKHIDNLTYQEICKITGFDLRTFTNNIEKLVTYVGEREQITIKDVKSVLRRTKKDQVYELTNAVTEKKFDLALFMLNAILADNIPPLVILATITNQIRKLMVAKSFTQSQAGKIWNPGMPYDHFKTVILPVLTSFDESLLNRLAEWEKKYKKEAVSTKISHKKKKTTTDLIIGKNPRNPYPIFQTLLKSSHFTQEELQTIMEILGEADLRLKTTGQDPKLILEDVIIRSCKHFSKNT